MPEGESRQKQIEGIEVLEERVERRFVLGLDDEQKVKTPLIVAHEGRFDIPLKLTHQKLAESLGKVSGRKGGFCIREASQLTMVAGETPTLMTGANNEEFQQALANGVIIIERPKSS